MPPLRKLNAEVNKMVNDAAFADELVSLGFQPVGGSIDGMEAASKAAPLLDHRVMLFRTASFQLAHDQAHL